MNVNLGISDNIRRSLQDDIDENARILQQDGKFTLTGRIALVTPPDMTGLGVYQVWHETTKPYGVNNGWIWVDDEGIQHVNCHPTDESHEPLY